MAIINIVGTAAGVFTTFAFIPQIVKIRKQGGDDLSYAMLAVYFVGVGLWFAYGLILRAPAIIWTNAITDVLVAVAIVLKATHRPRGGSEQRRASTSAAKESEFAGD